MKVFLFIFNYLLNSKTNHIEAKNQYKILENKPSWTHFISL